MSNVISLVFVLISVLVITFTGISQLGALTNEANSTINESSELYNSLQTANNVTNTAMSTMSVIPYLLILAIFIVGLGMLLF